MRDFGIEACDESNGSGEVDDPFNQALNKSPDKLMAVPSKDHLTLYKRSGSAGSNQSRNNSR